MATATNLNDTQLVLLTTASQRDAGNLLPLPASLSDGGPRIAKAIASLMHAGLVQESPTTIAAQVWRRDDDVRIGVVITDAGRIAIGVEPLAQIEEAAGEVESRTPLTDPSMASEKPLKAPSGYRTGSKQSLVIEMLSAEAGASLEALVAATGWLPHTTRAAITGLRKRGHAVLTEKRDGACCYRIAAVI